MPKLMKPSTFGCGDGFQEVYYESDNPTDKSKYEAGKVFCYLSRLDESDSSNVESIRKCRAMKLGECWKKT